MKKILIINILLSFLSFGRSIIGNTIFLEDEDIHVLETNDNAGEYLENKYPGKYAIEIKDDNVYIYPKIQSIEINSKVTSKDEIQNYLPSLYIGKIIKDETNLIDNIDSDIASSNKNMYLYTRMSIDEEGKYSAIIDEYVEKDLNIDLDLNLSNVNSKFDLKLQKTNFNKGDIFNFEAGVSTTEFKPKVAAEYILNDSKFKNVYSLKMGYNEKMYLNADFKRYIYSSENKGKLEFLILNSKIGFNYLDNSYVYSEFDLNYKYKNNSYVKLDFKGGLGVKTKLSAFSLEPYIKSSVLFEYYGGITKIYLKGLLNFNLMKADNKNLFILEDDIDNIIKGDIITGWDAKIELPKIYFSNMYVFNDFYISKKYGINDNKYVSNIGLGFETDFFDDMHIKTEFGKNYKNNKSSFLFNLGLKMSY